MKGDAIQTAPTVLRLSAAFADLPPALARVAKYVINYPGETTRLSIEALSDVTESGQASIVRLVQMLGFSGFRAFKLALVAQLAATSRSDAGAGPVDAVHRLRREMVDSLDATAALVDRARLRSAVGAIMERRHVNIYAGGVSAMVGTILAAKLVRAGVWALCYADPNLGLEVVAPASRDAVAIAISDSGATPEPVRMLRAARAAGARTVAITSRPASAAAAHAEVVLLTAPIAQPPSRGFVTSIAAQIFVVQLLTEQVASAMDGGDVPGADDRRAGRRGSGGSSGRVR